MSLFAQYPPQSVGWHVRFKTKILGTRAAIPSFGRGAVKGNTGRVRTITQFVAWHLTSDHYPQTNETLVKNGMVYILNTNLNSEKRVRDSLQKIRGIGPFLANQVCDQLGLAGETRVKQLSFNQIDELKSLISQSHLTGNELSRFNRRNKGRIGLIGTYRGVRQSIGLPLRGQRTHGNSKTARRLKGRNF